VIKAPTHLVIVRVELTGLGVPAVRRPGDGHRHQTDALIGQNLEHGSGILRCGQALLSSIPRRAIRTLIPRRFR